MPNLLMRISRASVTPVYVVKKYYNRQCPGEKVKIRSNEVTNFSSGGSVSKAARDTARVEATPEEGATISVRRAKAIKERQRNCKGREKQNLTMRSRLALRLCRSMKNLARSLKKV